MNPPGFYFPSIGSCSPGPTFTALAGPPVPPDRSTIGVKANATSANFRPLSQHSNSLPGNVGGSFKIDNTQKNNRWLLPEQNPNHEHLYYANQESLNSGHAVVTPQIPPQYFSYRQQHQIFPDQQILNEMEEFSKNAHGRIDELAIAALSTTFTSTGVSPAIGSSPLPQVAPSSSQPSPLVFNSSSSCQVSSPVPIHPSVGHQLHSPYPRFPQNGILNSIQPPNNIQSPSHALSLKMYQQHQSHMQQLPSENNCFKQQDSAAAAGHESSPMSFASSHSPVLLPPPSHQLARFSMDDFEIFNTLGTGTFGRVYLCRPRDDPNSYYALKMMHKVEILRLKQLDHIYSEKSILAHVHFPFIVRLYATFQNAGNIYMLLEYAMGGELFSYLRKLGRFSLEAAKFYAAEILLALEYLHSRNIVYRDLKPENLLLDARGHIKIADFGFAKVVPDKTWTLCGTPEYLAPEIIQGRGHGKEVDWWALGVLIYEMLIGYPPFYDSNPFLIYEKILTGPLTFPDHVDPVSKDLICRLLMRDKTQRLGNLRHGALDIKSHPWFRGIPWNALLCRTAQTPFIPTYRYPGDTGNFDPYPELTDSKGEWADLDPFQHLFINF